MEIRCGMNVQVGEYGHSGAGDGSSSELRDIFLSFFMCGGGVE